jgi:hypothetical protein
MTAPVMPQPTIKKVISEHHLRFKFRKAAKPVVFIGQYDTPDIADTL